MKRCLSISNKKILNKIECEISTYHNWYCLALILLYECHCDHQHLVIHQGIWIVFTYYICFFFSFLTETHFVIAQLFIIHGHEYCRLKHSIRCVFVVVVFVVLNCHRATQFWLHQFLWISSFTFLSFNAFKEVALNCVHISGNCGRQCTSIRLKHKHCLVCLYGCVSMWKWDHLRWLNGIPISIYWNHYDEIANILSNSLLLLMKICLFLTFVVLLLRC